MMIVGFENLSLCDWHGKLCSVVYVSGCNYRCQTCHNWDIAFFPTRHRPLNFEDVIHSIKKDRNWLDGIVVTGGEPTTYQSIEYIVQVFSEILPVKVDTNGSQLEVIQKILPYTTLFDVDVKGPLSKYKELTYSDECEIDKVLEFAKQYPDKFRFRTTLVPQLTESDIEITTAFVNSFGFELTFQPYRDRSAQWSLQCRS